MERRSIRGESSRGRDDSHGGDRDRDRGGRDRDEGRGRDSGRYRGEDRGRDRGGRDSGGRRGFTYQARSVEDVTKRANESSRQFDSFIRDSINTFTAKDGDNTIRVVPPTWEGARHFAIDVWVHYGIGPDEQSYLCLHKMKDEPCPICEELAEARRNREDEEYIRNLEPTRRSLFYVVDRDDEKTGVQAWAAPFTKIDQAIVKVSYDRRSGDVLPIDDPDDGYDVEFEKKGKGIGTQYLGVAIARRSSPLGNDEWLNFAMDNPLPSILEYYSYDHIAKVFGGGGGRADKQRDSGRDDSRDREHRDRDRDSRDDGSRRPSRDDNRREASRQDEPEHTWQSIHALEGAELDGLVERLDLNINPNKFDSDEDLADAICGELKIEKEGRGGRSAETSDDRGRLAEMRSRRG